MAKGLHLRLPKVPVKWFVYCINIKKHRIVGTTVHAHLQGCGFDFHPALCMSCVHVLQLFGGEGGSSGYSVFCHIQKTSHLVYEAFLNDCAVLSVCVCSLCVCV